MHQLSLNEWPKGLEEDALQLSLNPEEIARRSNLKFEEGQDSLDAFLAAVVDIGDGKSFAFQRHLHSPTPGTTVLLRQGSIEELTCLVRLLRLKLSDVTWTAPHVEKPLHLVFRKRGKAKWSSNTMSGLSKVARKFRFGRRARSSDRGKLRA